MAESVSEAILRDASEQERLLPAVGLFDELAVGVGKDPRVVDPGVEKLRCEADEVGGFG